MKRICGVLLLVLCFANMEFGFGRPMKQSLESFDDREAVTAKDKDIVYEEGFEVKTILDGHKINVSIYSIFPVPGENYVYAIDMRASEVLKLKVPIDESAQISHFAGSTDGEAGHKDGWGKSSLFNHPKDLTVDDDGNVYVADVRDCVIRKITYDGVVSSIAGESNVSGFADGEGKKARLSADFDVTYVSKICSLLITDRGNKRLRLIQLKRPEICRNGQNASGVSVGLRGLLFVISGTFVMTTLAVLTLKNAGLREHAVQLQTVLRDRLTWRRRVEDLYSPLQNGAVPQLYAPLQTTSLPARLPPRLPDLIDLSFDTSPSANVAHSAPPLTEKPHYHRGALVPGENPEALSESLLLDTHSAPAAILSELKEDVDNQRQSTVPSSSAQ